jgi:hypothetical protein
VDQPTRACTNPYPAADGGCGGEPQPLNHEHFVPRPFHKGQFQGVCKKCTRARQVRTLLDKRARHEKAAAEYAKLEAERLAELDRKAQEIRRKALEDRS